MNNRIKNNKHQFIALLFFCVLIASHAFADQMPTQAAAENAVKLTPEQEFVKRYEVPEQEVQATPEQNKEQSATLEQTKKKVVTTMVPATPAIVSSPTTQPQTSTYEPISQKSLWNKLAAPPPPAQVLISNPAAIQPATTTAPTTQQQERPHSNIYK